MNPRAMRAAKGFAAASVATFVALFGHVLGGGDMPGWLGVVSPLILSSAACVLLAGRRLSIVRLTLSVAASQLLFHFLFVLGASSTATVHGHHGSMVMTGGAISGAAVSSMGAGHVAAAAVTIAALYFGERVLLGLSVLVRLLAARLFAAVVPVLPARSPRAHRAVGRPVGIRLSLVDALTVASRRGPPALTA